MDSHAKMKQSTTFKKRKQSQAKGSRKNNIISRSYKTDSINYVIPIQTAKLVEVKFSDLQKVKFLSWGALHIKNSSIYHVDISLKAS